MTGVGDAPMLPFDWEPDGGQYQPDTPMAMPGKMSAVGTVALETPPPPVAAAAAEPTAAVGVGGWDPAPPSGGHVTRLADITELGRGGGPPPEHRSSVADHVARLLARAPRLTDRQKMDLRRLLGPPARWGT